MAMTLPLLRLLLRALREGCLRRCALRLRRARRHAVSRGGSFRSSSWWSWASGLGGHGRVRFVDSVGVSEAIASATRRGQQRARNLRSLRSARLGRLRGAGGPGRRLREDGHRPLADGLGSDRLGRVAGEDAGEIGDPSDDREDFEPFCPGMCMSRSARSITEPARSEGLDPLSAWMKSMSGRWRGRPPAGPRGRRRRSGFAVEDMARRRANLVPVLPWGPQQVVERLGSPAGEWGPVCLSGSGSPIRDSCQPDSRLILPGRPASIAGMPPPRVRRPRRFLQRARPRSRPRRAGGGPSTSCGGEGLPPPRSSSAGSIRLLEGPPGREARRGAPRRVPFPRGKHPDLTRLRRQRGARPRAARGAIAGIQVSKAGTRSRRDRPPEELFEEGMRVLTLVWNSHLSWIRSCRGAPVPGSRRLSAFGRSVVRSMNELGMVVDLSHAGERSFYDAIETRPCPCSRATRDAGAARHPRNLTDDQLRELGCMGGVVGIPFCVAFLEGGAKEDEAVAWTAPIVLSAARTRRSARCSGTLPPARGAAPASIALSPRDTRSRSQGSTTSASARTTTGSGGRRRGSRGRLVLRTSRGADAERGLATATSRRSARERAALFVAATGPGRRRGV
jgi:hypothetical protein